MSDSPNRPGSSSAAGDPARATDAARPASPAQHGIWLTSRLTHVPEVFHLALRIGFDRIDADALARAVTATVARHPALSSALVERDGVLRPVPAGRTPALTVLEPVGEPVGECADACADALAKRLAEELALPFDLARGPLARFTLDRRADGSAELLVVAHHAVFDGNSKDVLVADLAAGYAAALTSSADGGRSAADGDTDAAPLDPALLARAAAFHGPRWAAATAPVLPGGPRAVTDAGPGEAVAWRLDGAAGAALADAARAAGVTRFEFLLAALHGLLHRYGGEAVPVAVPFSTRGPWQRRAIGLFVNELPVYAPAGQDGETPFARYAAAVRTEARLVSAHRAVPFGSAVPGLTPRAGLAPVSFGYRRRTTADPVFPGSTALVDWTVFPHAARNTLHLQAVDGADGIDLSLQYDPAVLASAAARRIAGHFATLLAAAVADPATPLGDLPLLDGAERHLVTTAWNDTARAYPADRTVLDLVRERAGAAPDALAVVAGEERLTYRALLRRADRLAGALTAAGIGRDDLVGLHLARTADLPAALLAVHAVGAGYLPLDPGYPAERLAFVLADSGAALLLADREPEPAVAAAAPAVLRLGGASSGANADTEGGAEGGADGDAGAGDGTDAGADAGRLAYVLYTSGSTGRPKGVEIGHRALVNLLTAFATRLGSGPRDVWLGLTSLSFDISALELLLPLTTGGRLVLAPDGLSVDGPGLRALVEREGVTHVQATPSGWRVLLGAGPLPSGLTGLVGGEALPLPLARQLRAGTDRLFNVYGPTETTVWSTCAELPDDPEAVRIGRPIANTRALVLDRRRRPLPIGVPGELHLGGDGLAEGYLGRPELTAERFVDDPFGAPGDRLYRTGDLVAWSPDGELEFLGRLDDQVKVRGHRIELGEVEAALLTHPAVAEAAAAVHREEAAAPGEGGRGVGGDGDGGDGGDAVDGEPFVAGYLVPAAGQPAPAPAELRSFLQRLLPGAAVPQRFLVLDRLPLTPNGKLDRRALPVPPVPVEAPAGPAAGPDAEDEVLAAVLGIWSEVLRMPGLGPEDDLFDLGGHSLTIIQITARIRDLLGVELDFDVFFASPTPLGIAAAVRELR
ncbi:amino acid adenylation domain-containing protein [Kitasatospora purpeofusca]|uniref:non-ribosomal peptide synthetase n=1 Tax=Kitasatospora purpeofusca TaxID=67352 RepID=UPI002A5A185A|nr:amino acid adenylation domain-containing protein [Kitasatospora purpeofusca]MDY0814464.1 amino acid adenylation domain-containing protein [Kitasatospora purpeofusca]